MIRFAFAVSGLIALGALANAIADETAVLMTNTPLTAPKDLTPPAAAEKPHHFSHHGITVEDPWHWLKDQSYPKVDDPDILAYLTAENAYFEAVMADQAPLTEALFEELKGRVKQDDSSVPAKNGDYLYWWRYEPGAQYRQWLRKPAAGGEEALILDEPALAEGLDYFRLGGLAVSPDANLLAYTTDTDGSERFTVSVKDLSTGKVFADIVSGVAGSVVWAEDGSGLFYVELTENWRPYRVKFHRLMTEPAADRLIYEESDPSFFVGVSKTQSRAFILISAGDHITQEVRAVPADQPLAELRLISERRAGHEYYVDHANGRFWIRTNDQAQDFRLVSAPEDRPEPDHWREEIGPAQGQYLQGHTAFKDFLLIDERIDGLDQIRIRTYAGEEHRVAFPEPVYAASPGNTPDFAVDQVRLTYESMITPDTVYDYDVAARQLITRKVQDIPSGYDKSQYRTERLMAPARDGTMIPVSIVYRAGFPKDRSQPLHLTGYGAYGYGYPPGFSSSRLSLLDRGFALAIAHIRGGDELGRGWYEAGKLNQRTNTFNDFVDVARFLIDQGYAADGGISASGGSAGGELMGAVVNQAPELWRAVVLHVPFVDVLNTMLDTSLPLTPIEWPEWGNPIEDKAAFELIRSYSPYDQINAKAYPPMLVTGGLNDPRVTYWEPAKWTAKLRATKTDDNLLLLKTNMGAGHAGKSGRFERLYETAEEYTFLLMAFGLTQKAEQAATAAR